MCLGSEFKLTEADSMPRVAPTISIAFKDPHGGALSAPIASESCNQKKPSQQSFLNGKTEIWHPTMSDQE